ncbi:hypothetical protein PtA15_16A179 [Puccinia triticina]|uniref:Uncharacterized protein n=1 Tax=Puccinia triticina TaxID=208348 RepID=A0ABY7D3T1_9BASI|nr:uncharacterized protein PtA15_16A179 [Puccinia triticina]WAQ92273.1 hypothetical protein PtA15_16A179 [Puccinia triticina]
MPIDQKFWNDGIYYHSKAPWEIKPDVRTGITCLLVLKRVDEDIELITQEMVGVQVDDGEEDSLDPKGAWEDVNESH